jgi:hypothetical protein
MRIVFGVLSLLVVVAIVGVLAKKQLQAVSPSAPGTSAQGVTTPGGTPKQQVEQVKQKVESILQQPRPSGDEAK